MPPSTKRKTSQIRTFDIKWNRNYRRKSGESTGNWIVSLFSFLLWLIAVSDPMLATILKISNPWLKFSLSPLSEHMHVYFTYEVVVLFANFCLRQKRLEKKESFHIIELLVICIHTELELQAHVCQSFCTLQHRIMPLSSLFFNFTITILSLAITNWRSWLLRSSLSSHNRFLLHFAIS